MLLSQGGGPGKPSTKPTLTPKADSLQRIDPKTNKLAATIGVGHSPDAVAAGDGRVWVGSAEDQSVLRIDPKTNRGHTDGNGAGGPNSIAAAPGSVFVANSDAHAVADRPLDTGGLDTRPTRAIAGSRSAKARSGRVG